MKEIENFSGERVPPQNIEAEEAIVGGILLDPEAIGRVIEFLEPSSFYVPAHGTIYRAAMTLHCVGKPTDLLTVMDWLENNKLLESIGGQAKLVELVDRTVSAVNIDALADLVKDKAIRRQLIQAGTEIIQLGFSTADPLPEVLDQAEQKIFNLTQMRAVQGPVPVSEIVIKAYQEIEERHESHEMPGLKADFADLDAMLGGFQRADLIIIAGRPSMGKTAFSLNVAYNIAKLHQLPVLVFSLEMSKEQLVHRLLSSESGVDSNRLRAGRVEPKEWEKIFSAIQSISELPIFIDDSPNPPLMEMRSHARRLQAEHGGQLGLILIDYLQLMEGSSDNRVQEISKITRGLKGLARELNVPTIALSQLSRSVEARTNKRPMMSDLRESGCLAGDSLVTLADSGLEVPIAELVGKSGFAVWGLNVETMKQERAIVTNAFCTGVKPVWKMTTAAGNSIEATANHKFYTAKGWQRLDELCVGDSIAMVRSIPATGQRTMSDAELALLGHLIGDGCTLPRHAIQYTTREIDLAELVAMLAKEVFGDEVNPRINAERDWYQVHLPASYRLIHNVKNPITKWLEDLNVFGLRFHEKFIPPVVFSQPSEAIALFLRHLWATGGCIKPTKGKKCLYPAIYYVSSSEKLTRGVRSLLLRLNINAAVRVISQGKKGRLQYQIWLGGKSDLEIFANVIGAVGNYNKSSLEEVKLYLSNANGGNRNRDLIPNELWQTQVNIAQKYLNLTAKQMQDRLGIRYSGTTDYKYDITRERLSQVGNILEADEILKLAISDIYWDKVKEMSFFGDKMVYDLTVENLENFAAQGFYLHNSIEQDADLIMMLYRDAYYNPDTPDRDTTEIIITKHRNGPTGTVKLVFDPALTKFKNIMH
jgi:replicative DNA helicase